MRWVIKDEEFNVFMHKQFKQHHESPDIHSEKITWQLVLYPQGHDHNCEYIEIWLASLHGKNYYHPSIKQLTINIELHCSVLKTHWDIHQKTLDIHQNGTFHYKFEHKIKISDIQKKRLKIIKISCNIDVIPPKTSLVRPQLQTSSNLQHTQPKADKQKAPNRPSLVTTPSYKTSQLYHTNAAHTSFIWRIPTNQLKRFINSSVGRKWSSPVFDGVCKDAQFQIVCYPNGANDENKGSVAIYLECVMYPSNESSAYSMMDIWFDIQCKETFTRNSDAFHYCNRNDINQVPFALLPIHSLELSQLKYLSDISFTIHLILMRYHLMPADYGIMGVVDYIHDFVPMKEISATWILPITPLFLNASNDKMKSFVSKRFDIWCLRCKPRDISNRVLLELYLISLPFDVDDIEIMVTLRCKCFGIKWKKRVKIVNGEKKDCVWEDVDLYTEQFKTMKSVEFECNVKILHYYRKGREVVLNENDHNNEEEKECEQEDDIIKDLNKQIEVLSNKMSELQNRMDQMQKSKSTDNNPQTRTLGNEQEGR